MTTTSKTTKTTKTQQLVSDASFLREPYVDGKPGCDVYSKPAAGRITYGAACEKYGKPLVHRALSAGLVSLVGVTGDAFDPANAKADTKLQENGATIA